MTSLLISRPNAIEICSAIFRQPKRGLRRFISDHRSNQFAGGTFGSRATESIRDISKMIFAIHQNLMKAQQRRGLSYQGEFNADASGIPKTSRIPASADPTRLDWGRLAATAS